MKKVIDGIGTMIFIVLIFAYFAYKETTAKVKAKFKEWSE